MAYVGTFSHVTVGTIPSEVWDEAWFSIESWKGYLQSFPGYQTMRFAARTLENGDVRVHLAIVWEYPEQLQEWAQSSWTGAALLRALAKPAYDISTETFEDLA